MHHYTKTMRPGPVPSTLPLLSTPVYANLSTVFRAALSRLPPPQTQDGSVLSTRRPAGCGRPAGTITNNKLYLTEDNPRGCVSAHTGLTASRPAATPGV